MYSVAESERIFSRYVAGVVGRNVHRRPCLYSIPPIQIETASAETAPYETPVQIIQNINNNRLSGRKRKKNRYDKNRFKLLENDIYVDKASTLICDHVNNVRGTIIRHGHTDIYAKNGILADRKISRLQNRINYISNMPKNIFFRTMDNSTFHNLCTTETPPFGTEKKY